jgi:hypothetical protein
MGEVTKVKKWMFKAALLLLPVAAMNLLIATAAFPADDHIPRITVQELKAKLDRGEHIIILDMRTGNDWARSKYKIKGAIRMPINQLNRRSGEWPKDQEIVTYCT